MPSLEHVVRPVTVVNFRPSNAKDPSVPVIPDDVVLLFGASGSSIFHLQQTVKQSVNNDRSDKEVSRTFDVVRIKNPDDESTFVDTEVMTGYQARNVIDKSRTKLLFEPPQSSGNVEVLKRNQTRNS
jgi:hypothetical protein